MWSNVISASSPQGYSPDDDESRVGNPPPPTRYKHATTMHYSRSDACYYMYVYGGNSNRFALKDFWELNVQTGEWREIVKPTDSPTGTDTWPPKLQEHTLVSANGRLYMFGGELCANSDTSSHVWVWQREHENRGWEKIRFKQENSSSGGVSMTTGNTTSCSLRKSYQCAPTMRRGHTAVVCEVDGNESMVIYGGYRDLKGSLGDCWAYAVATNTWTLLSSAPSSLSPQKQTSFWTNILSYWTNSSASSSSTSYTNLSQSNGYYRSHDHNSSTGPIPPSRSNASAVHYNGKMYVYGGMCDLVELSDFWVLELESRRWSQIKCLFNPGVLKGHAAVVVGPFMYVFGGETKGGMRVDDVWRFDFFNETFERLQFPGCHPCARVFATATKLPKARKRESVVGCSGSRVSSSDDELRAQQQSTSRPFKKSTSVVRFADTQHLVTYSDDFVSESSSTSPVTNTPSCSDYSSMETINYVENPNYRKYISSNVASNGESYEMKPMGYKEPVVQHPEYVLVVGGNETHKSAVFSKRDLVVWRLRVDCFCTDLGDQGTYTPRNPAEMTASGGGVALGDPGFGAEARLHEIERGDSNFEVEF